MQKRLLVFDWDQTLWHSWEVHREGIWYAVERLGLRKPSAAEIIETLGGSLEAEFRNLFGHDGSGLVKHYLDFYFQHHLDLGGAFPGVKEVLTKLREHGYLLAILSNKRQRAGLVELEKSGMGGLFQRVLFREGSVSLKPEPAGLRKLLTDTNTPAWEALYIGDSAEDILCARNAGVTSVAALWGCLDTPSTLAQGPDHVWEQVQQALEMLG